MKAEIQNLIDRKALFVVNHSGGKDSQAMLIRLLAYVPRELIVVVHASLGEVEWEGALELAERQAAEAGVPFIVARAVHRDGSPKTFFSMVERNLVNKPGTPPFPTAKYKQCTSDLKRGPIEREIIAYMKAHGLRLVVNCEGIRAAESNDRKKRKPFERLNDKRNAKGDVTHALAKAGREAFEYLPIFELSTAEVFATIADAGQTPHPAYAAGNERLSCVFCIMGSPSDIAHGAKARPELFAKWAELEERSGYVLHMRRKSLRELVAEAAL